MSKLILCGLFTLLCLVCLTEAYLPQPEAKRLCRLRTGLLDSDLADTKTRNEGCSIDCITKQGTILTAYPEDGFPCYVGEGYKCSLGKCRSPDGDKLDQEVKSELNQFDIIIKSALVADRDPYPTQGESDAFVLVEVVSGGEPLLKNGEVLCYTHVVQDNKKPRWNFSCRPQPMKASAILRFVVLDSDKPDTNPQFLGTTTQRLESLMNAGLRSIKLEQGTLPGGPYLLEIEVKGKKLSSSA